MPEHYIFEIKKNHYGKTVVPVFRTLFAAIALGAPVGGITVVATVFPETVGPSVLGVTNWSLLY